MSKVISAKLLGGLATAVSAWVVLGATSSPDDRVPFEVPILILNYLSGRYLLASGKPTGSVAPAWLATASARASLIGFISTTVLDWRREAREAKAAKLEVMRTRLELEKTRLELEKLRREQAEDAD